MSARGPGYLEFFWFLKEKKAEANKLNLLLFLQLRHSPCYSILCSCDELTQWNIILLVPIPDA